MAARASVNVTLPLSAKTSSKVSSAKASADLSAKNGKDIEVELSDIYATKDTLIRPANADDQEALADFYSRFDYVMVFPMMGPEQTHFDKKQIDKSEQSLVARNVINTMLEQGIEIHTFLSMQKDELFVLLRASEERLLKFAHETNFHVRLNPEYCKDQLAKGLEKYRIKPVKIADEVRFTNMHPFDDIFGRYDSRVDTKDVLTGQNVYEAEGNQCLLSDVSRLKLFYLLLLGSKRHGGCKLDINTMLLKGDILTLYPLHNERMKADILKKTSQWCSMPWSAPFNDIRNYFGEKWSLFYAFIGHQSKWLVIPSILGLMAQTTVWSTGPNYSHPVMPFFSVITMVWAIFWVNSWKREEKKRALHWGMLGFEEAEQQRPQFRGDLISSYVDGAFIVWYPQRYRRAKQFLSYTIIISIMLLVVASLSGIYAMRNALDKTFKSNAQTIASILNAVQIYIFNAAYNAVARSLNDAENHETDTDYVDSMVAKTFVFQFVNSYLPFFYLGFVAQYLPRPASDSPNYMGTCGFYNCMGPLAITLQILYASRLTTDNAIAIFMDWWYQGSKRNAEMKGVPKGGSLCTPESQYILLATDTLNDNISFYADTAIQFGYCVLFVACQPICFAATLASNYLRTKLTTWKYMSWYQRPIPVGCEDIGTWQSIFYVIVIVGIFTNGGIICFTMDVLKSDSETLDSFMSESSRPLPFQRAEFSAIVRVWIFFGYVVAMLLVLVLVTLIMPKDSTAVLIQQERSKFIVSKIIEHQEDEDFDDEDDDKQLEEAVEEQALATAEYKASKGIFSCLNIQGASAKKRKKQAMLQPFRIIGIPQDEEDVQNAIKNALQMKDKQEHSHGHGHR
jgi:hypothetical protein